MENRLESGSARRLPDAESGAMPPAMRIGLIVHSPSPHQKVLLDSLFQALGKDLVVAYALPKSPGRTWGAPVADGPTMLLPYRMGPGCSRRLARWIDGAKCDVWVVGSTFTSRRTHVLADILTSTGRCWAFLGEPPRPRTGLRRMVRDYMLHRILRSCHGVIATGKESARRYRLLLGDDRPVTNVPYYIPLESWLSQPLVRAPAANAPIRFVTLAQLVHRKGLDVLIEACQQLPKGSYAVDVYGDGPLRAWLQRQIYDAGVSVSLHLPLPFDRRMEAFAGRHCFVFPTRWDGWGMAPVEALAAGLPVIASDQCMSAYDFISPDADGWIVPCAADAFTKAMQQVIDHRERLPAMSAAARGSTEGYRPEIGAAELIRFCGALL